MQLKAFMYYAFVNIRYSLTIFWAICLGILLLSLGMDVIFGNDESAVYFSMSGPVYVFAAIMGYWSVQNILPYTVKMGSTRQNLYVGTGISFFLLCLGNALVANTIMQIMNTVYGSSESGGVISLEMTSEAGKSEVSFSHIGGLIGKDNWLDRVIIDTSISFFLLAVCFLIALVFYRYHLLGGFAFLGSLLLLFIFAISKGWVLDFMKDLYANFSFVFFYELALVAVGLYAITYLLIRKMPV